VVSCDDGWTPHCMMSSSLMHHQLVRWLHYMCRSSLLHASADSAGTTRMYVGELRISLVVLRDSHCVCCCRCWRRRHAPTSSPQTTAAQCCSLDLSCNSCSRRSSHALTLNPAALLPALMRALLLQAASQQK
jgi:hypothetical protein